MGNETSSVKIHSLLSAEDIKRLRAAFPGGGAGVQNPQNLEWGHWKMTWPLKLRKQLEQILSASTVQQAKPAGSGVISDATGISFNNYQEMAGSCIRGTTEERIKLLFRLAITDNPPKTSAQITSAKISASALKTFVEDIILIASKLSIISKSTTLEEEVKLQPNLSKPASSLANSLMHDIDFPGSKPRKECLVLQPEEDAVLDFERVERWTVMHCPLFDRIFLFVLASTFGLDTGNEEFALLPTQGVKLQFNTEIPGMEKPNTKLSPADAFFLNSCLPDRELRQQWRPLFNSAQDGESFSKFAAALTNAKTSRTPTFVIVWEDGEDGGHVFGGYGSDPWAIGPKFFGDNTSFLFNLHPKQYMYEALRYNSNYQYMNTKAKTFPNGLGMGGQLEFFGLWLDAEYGNGKCTPSCSSFATPQLSKKENFKYHHVEVWGTGDEPEDDEDEEGGGGGALNKDPEAMAVMEMMGKTFISKDVKAADANLEKQKDDEERSSKVEKD